MHLSSNNFRLIVKGLPTRSCIIDCKARDLMTVALDDRDNL
jgi:hypothetical protein